MWSVGDSHFSGVFPSAWGSGSDLLKNELPQFILSPEWDHVHGEYTLVFPDVSPVGHGEHTLSSVAARHYEEGSGVLSTVDDRGDLFHIEERVTP